MPVLCWAETSGLPGLADCEPLFSFSQRTLSQRTEVEGYETWHPASFSSLFVCTQVHIYVHTYTCIPICSYITHMYYLHITHAKITGMIYIHIHTYSYFLYCSACFRFFHIAMRSEKLDVVVCACDTSTPDAEAERLEV